MNVIPRKKFGLLMTCLTTTLHEERLEAAVQALIASGAKSVADLGCGSGALLRRLVREPQFETIVGVDTCGESLYQASEAIREQLVDRPLKLSIVAGSYAERDPRLAGFDACTMIETIEHNDPVVLGKVEETVFGFYRPRALVMTTPNAEFNDLLGVARHEFRHPDHRFEWDRARFRSWATAVARRRRYRVRIRGIGDYCFGIGEPTQMAIFSRVASCEERCRT